MFRRDIGATSSDAELGSKHMLEPFSNLERKINSCMKCIPSCPEINKIDVKYPLSTHMHVLNPSLYLNAGCVPFACPVVKKRKEVL